MSEAGSTFSPAAPAPATVEALLALAGYAPDASRALRVHAEFTRFATMANALLDDPRAREAAPLPVFRP